MNSSKQSSTSDDQSAAFFNYHEYTETYYCDLDNLNVKKEHSIDEALVITHYPNIYVPPQSIEYETTRIVRIPRCFDKSLQYPQFSEKLPGFEEGAVKDSDNLNKFQIEGCLDGQYFGTNSHSPLSQYFTLEEFETLVNDINRFLQEMYEPSSFINIINIVMGWITFGLWTIIFETSFNRRHELSVYIENFNNDVQNKQRQLSIVPFEKNGFLSLEFAIARPQLRVI